MKTQMGRWRKQRETDEELKEKSGREKATKIQDEDSIVEERRGLSEEQEERGGGGGGGENSKKAELV